MGRKIKYCNTGIELKLQKALYSKGIIFETQKNIIGHPDIFIPPNICIFCDGDYWHANPDFYEPQEMMRKGLKAIKIWKRDLRTEKRLTAKGYVVLRFWEWEINEQIEQCLRTIEQAITSHS